MTNRRKAQFLKTISILRERGNVATHPGIRQGTVTWSYRIWHAKIITTIIGHQLGIYRHVSSSSNSSFKGFPSRLRQFGLQFRIIFGILLFILVICRSQFDLYRLSFSATGSTLSKIFFVPFVVQNGVPARSSEKFQLDWCQSFFILF
jgi:hypothetical protein